MKFRLEPRSHAAQPPNPADRAPFGGGRRSERLRADGAVEFSRPGFKQSADRLVLEIATASAVDHPLLLDLPFVAPGE